MNKILTYFYTFLTDLNENQDMRSHMVRLSCYELHKDQGSEWCTFLRGDYEFLSNMCETLSKGSVNHAADYVWVS